ncbi:MAG TPA: tetratricopeptide repeat protein [Vicinamibacterales bacterium]|nr:tetratricopeptide repeat protein [Vicinamibacterales bacterium]
MTGQRFVVTAALLVLGACSRQARSTSPDPIALPDLSSLEASVQRQIRDRHTVLDLKLQNPATPPADLAAVYGDLARLLMAVGMNDLAVSGYMHAEAEAPTEMRWPYYLGHAYLRSGDRSRAAAAFQHASRLSPSDPSPLIWLGATSLDDGRPEDAQAAFSRALALQPQLAAAWFGAGRAALALKAYTEAARDFERVLAIDGRASAVQYPLAVAYRALGDPQKAAAHLRQRGDVTPELDDPLMQSDDDVLDSSVGSEHRGMQALKRGDWRFAIAEFRRGLELKPDDVTLRYWLGAALYASGDGLAAEREFRTVVQRAPDNTNGANAHFSLGAIDDAKGRRREAIEEYSAAVKADPTLPAARLRLGDALRTSGQPEASLAQYERAVDLDPRLVDAWIGGARSLIGLARYDRARDWLLRARRVHPERNELAELEARLPPPRR